MKTTATAMKTTATMSVGSGPVLSLSVKFTGMGEQGTSPTGSPSNVLFVKLRRTSRRTFASSLTTEVGYLIQALSPVWGRIVIFFNSLIHVWTLLKLLLITSLIRHSLEFSFPCPLNLHTLLEFFFFFLTSVTRYMPLQRHVGEFVTDTTPPPLRTLVCLYLFNLNSLPHTVEYSPLQLILPV
jgi:hypothetical protein